MNSKFDKLKHGGENLKSIGKTSRYDKYSGLRESGKNSGHSSGPNDNKKLVAKHKSKSHSKKNRKENTFLSFIGNNKFMIILVMALIMILVFGTFIYIKKKYSKIDEQTSENDKISNEENMELITLKERCRDLHQDNLIIGQNFEGLKSQYERLCYDYDNTRLELENLKTLKQNEQKQNKNSNNINYKNFADKKEKSESEESESEQESELESDDEQEINIPEEK